MNTDFTRILVPVDFGAESAAAFSAATSLARSVHAAIHLLHVATEPILPAATTELYGIDIVRLRQELIDEANAGLAAMAATATGIDVTWEVQFGRPADRIARAASEIGAGLIVMGTHGRGIVGHLFIGSVAERVIRLARCPVMTVREFGAVRLTAPDAQAAQLPESALT
jgi:nucleotide-binding universal stress UspA family protein